MEEIRVEDTVQESDTVVTPPMVDTRMEDTVVQTTVIRLQTTMQLLPSSEEPMAMDTQSKFEDCGLCEELQFWVD